MNTTASFLPEPSWSRRCSTETVFSIQGRETDIVQDSSDCQLDSEEDVEYEPVTEPEDEPPISDATSGQSDEELTTTHAVISQWWSSARAGSPAGESSGAGESCESGSAGEWGSAGESGGSGEASEPAPAARYRRCARCRAPADATAQRYQYCSACFKLRKDFFPPRPKRKAKLETPDIPRTLSQDSGVETASTSSQGQSSQELLGQDADAEARRGKLKRRSESADRTYKRPRLESESDNERVEVAPLVKTISDPAVTIETLDGSKDKDNLCIICCTEPKSGVFVHRRVAHICCCYSCAVKVWSKARRCPICNCKVSNVLKAVVM